MIFSHYNGKTPSCGGGGSPTTNKRKVIDYSNNSEIYNNFEWETPNYTYTAESECYVIGTLFTYSSSDADTPTKDNCINVKVNDTIINLVRVTSTSVAISNQITVHLQQGDSLKIDRTTGSCVIKGLLKKYGLKEI